MPPRQALGLLLAFFLILGGRQVRQRVLLDDQGLLKDELWLDGLLTPTTAQAAPRGTEGPPRLLTEPLPINTCSRDSLTLLPGVGEVMAGRIADLRARGVRFTCREDLQKVRGIGPRLSARLDTLVVYAPATADSL